MATCHFLETSGYYLRRWDGARNKVDDRMAPMARFAGLAKDSVTDYSDSS